MKNEKGITLVALTITIIVMIILAGIVITFVVGDNGILNKADVAGKKQVYATVAEKIKAQSYYITQGESAGKIDLSKTEDNIIALGLEEVKSIKPSSNLLMVVLKDDTTVEISGINGRNGTDLDILKAYAKGKKAKEIHNGSTFINNDIIPDAETSIKMVDAKLSEKTLDVYVEFKEEQYKIIITIDESKLENLEGLEALGELIVEDVVLGGLTQGREGKTVIYDSDNDSSTTEYWTVITDRDGLLEIVSNDVMGSLTLGVGDTYVTVTEDLDGDGTIGNEADIAIASYNRSIQTINEFCQSLVTATDNDGVRSIGVSGNGSDSYYSSEFFDEKHKQFANTIKADDTNYDDFSKLNQYNQVSKDKKYFYASRSSYTWSQGGDEPRIRFGVVQYQSNRVISYFVELYPSGKIYGDPETAGVRPVVINPQNIQVVE